ncbi:MAG TPA: GcrA family cell cycle regulator [Candidatus Paceibacterota bacterium]|nr:GcrA family cell cycle regulator [Candidatus Paceibacterota bacterium]
MDKDTKKTRKWSRWSEYDIDLLKELYPNWAMSTQDIANQVGKKTRDVYKKARALGLPRRPRHPPPCSTPNSTKGPWTSEVVDELKRLRKIGVSFDRIAKHLGDKFTRSAVAGKLERLGLIGEQGRVTISSIGPKTASLKKKTNQQNRKVGGKPRSGFEPALAEVSNNILPFPTDAEVFSEWRRQVLEAVRKW